uniref:Uncharacterized protein n=1 Tax=Vitis vinifera TaxID=29760 RepID=A5AFX5_VITVI|nr:hypothetical protein VITISV_037533 [Vitis vinifera]
MATQVVPAVIVGGGRVGRALQGMGSGDDLLVKRGDSVPLDFAGPILVCTRNDDLDAVLESTPKSRWSVHDFVYDLFNLADLVFFQNGMLEPWLQSKGLSDADQVLAYFAVSKLGEPPIDGKTDTNPEGLTAAYGKWASAVAGRLHAGGLSCKVLDKEAFQKQMLEKLIWISAFMLVGARHPGATVGVVEKEFRSEVSSLIGELASAAAVEKGIVFDEGMEDRLCAYSRAVSHFPTAAKEVKSCHQLKIANSHSRYVYVHVTEFWFVSCSNAHSSNGEMVGSIHSPKRQLQKENQIHAHYIQNGSKN